MDGLFDDDMIEEVISDEEKEARRIKEAEHNIEAIAQGIFRPWVDQWYKGRYTQNKGHIVKILKETLHDGVNPELLRLAMDYLGHEAAPITKISLQFAIGQAQKHYERHGRSRVADTSSTGRGGYVEGFQDEPVEHNPSSGGGGYVEQI